jgi:hypothetical protein
MEAEITLRFDSLGPLSMESHLEFCLGSSVLLINRCPAEWNVARGALILALSAEGDTIRLVRRQEGLHRADQMLGSPDG